MSVGSGCEYPVGEVCRFMPKEEACGAMPSRLEALGEIFILAY